MLDLVLVKLLTVPTLAWVATLAYVLLQLAIWWWGLPGTSHPTHTTRKDVSHGLRTSMERVNVYRAWYTEANVITALGLAGVAVIVYLIITRNYGPLVPVLFMVAFGESDLLDGAAAKRHDCHTQIGEIIDPVRDRLALPVIGLAILCEIGLGAWLIPAVALVAFEGDVLLSGRHATQAHTTLNAHGIGKARQAIHLAMIALLLVMYYIATDLTQGSEEILTVSALAMMAFASLLATIHYRRQTGR